jgi:hypothetical protein
MLHTAYVSELGSSLEYLPTWLPTREIHLGDIVIADGESLRQVGHVNDYGLTFKINSASARANFEYSSSGAVSISTKLVGQIVPGSMLGEGEAGLVVKFNRVNAILFDASGCASSVIADLPQLGNAIDSLYSKGKWDRNRIVVTELVRASSATIIISGGEAAQVDLKARGTIRPGGIRLSDINANLETKHTVNVGFKIVASSGLTPLYRAGGIKRTLMRSAKFGPRYRDNRTELFGDFAATDLLAKINSVTDSLSAE